METKHYRLTENTLEKEYPLNDFEQGLTQVEAAKRLKENGPNKLETKQVPK